METSKKLFTKLCLVEEQGRVYGAPSETRIPW